MPEFTLDSTIQQVLDLGDPGRELLYEHGYDVGDGFQDVLSQQQSIREAARSGRLRDSTTLLRRLNKVPAATG
jgi:hypothetical protein